MSRFDKIGIFCVVGFILLVICGFIWLETTYIPYWDGRCMIATNHQGHLYDDRDGMSCYRADGTRVFEW